ncbi:restriction endonuclease subunit S [Thalassolituus oleivorans]|uniref:restriction endonuclease subunit S n=1 Tax=Thalassolituus oleivorans TaxID=187493 RepID=UPI0023F3A318|nr:restriction endonuclease subunit S [Thalassolituus oleivorans]
MNNQVAESSAKYLTEVEESAVPAGYKKTEVGVIPEDWDEFNLGKLVAALESGVSVNSLDKLEGFSHGYHVLKTSCVSNGVFISSESKSILPKDIKRAKCLVKKGSIIISRMNTPALVGELGFVPTDIPNLFLPDRLWQMRLRAEGSTNSKWLTYLLSYPAYAKKIKESATGTSGSMKNISKDNFLSLEIPLPSSVEQNAITNALSDVDALISELEKLIAKKQAIKTATMQQLLTGRKRLPEFSLREDGSQKGYKQSDLGEIPEDWEVLQLSGLCDVRDGTHDSPKYKDNGIPLVTSKNIVDDILDLTNVSLISSEDAFEVNKRSKVDKGDIIMSMIGTVGSAVLLMDEPEFCIKNVALLKPKKIFGVFLIQLIRSKYFQDYLADSIDGGIQKFVSLGTLRNMEVSLPSRAEQTAISTILSDMDQEIQALVQRLNKTRQIKQGMMQELLTGKTRLI